MSPHLFLARAIEPGLSLLPGYMTSDCARVMLMAIACQESNLSLRKQENGPALGYWQFEKAGVDAVLKSQALLATAVLTTCDVSIAEAHEALQYNDALACAFARLLLWSDPGPLPLIANPSGAYSYYVQNWQPGKPDQSRWPNAHTIAVTTVTAVIS